MAPSIIGRYEVIGELGKGAMGVVYRAKDPNIGRTVALKTMRLDVSGVGEEEMLKRFKHEAQLAGVMNHPNIVTIFDAGEDNGLFYIAMEFVEGKTIQALINEHRMLPMEQVIKITRDVCSGLDHAHAAGIIHRDVKPPNLMLMSTGTVKIMDFGIAKSSATMTLAGQVLGTPSYMSPEQVKGKKLDGRTDLFSFGVCLYEMVTGERPFAGKNLTTIIYKIVNEKPTPPRQLDMSIHPGLSAVIVKCLAKDPEERYQTGADLVRDLENYKSLVSDEAETSVMAPVDDSAKFAATKMNLHEAEDEPMDTMAFDSGKFSKQTYERELQATGKMQAAESGEIPSVNTTSQMQASTTGALHADSTTGSMPAAAPSTPVKPVTKIDQFEKTVYAPPKKTIVRPAASVAEKSGSADGLNWKMVGGIVTAVLLALAAVLYFTKKEDPPPVAPAKPAQTAPAPATGAATPSVGVTTPGTQADVQPGSTVPSTGASSTGTPATGTPVAVPPSQPAAAAPTGKRNEKTPAKPTTGAARVTSIPRGAKVTVDGVSNDAWVTDFTAKDLKPGSHEFTISKDGYVPQKMVQNITVGNTATFTAVLVVQGAVVTVNSDPDGANIVLDGKPTGQQTPADVKVDAGSHKIMVRKPGFREENTMVDLKDGESYKYAPTLESMRGGSGGNARAQFNPQQLVRFEQMMQNARKQGKGVVVVISEPAGATITSNGQAWPAPTPFMGPLTPGTYHVTVSLAGYRSVQKDIMVEAGKASQNNVKLQK